MLEFLESIITGVTCRYEDIYIRCLTKLFHSYDYKRMKPEESALGNALLSLTLWLSDVYAKAVEAYRLNGELSPGNILC